MAHDAADGFVAGCIALLALALFVWAAYGMGVTTERAAIFTGINKYGCEAFVKAEMGK